MAEISPLRRRMIEEHDRPQHVAGDAAILRQRGFEIQPVLRPLARLRPAFLLWHHARPGDGSRADPVRAGAAQTAGCAERR